MIALQSTKNFQTLEESRFECDADFGCSRFVKSSIVVFATRVLVWFLRNVQYAKHGFKSLEICLLYFYLKQNKKRKRLYSEQCQPYLVFFKLMMMVCHFSYLQSFQKVRTIYPVYTVLNTAFFKLEISDKI